MKILMNKKLNTTLFLFSFGMLIISFCFITTLAFSEDGKVALTLSKYWAIISIGSVFGIYYALYNYTKYY